MHKVHSHHSQLLTNGGFHGDKQIEVEKGKKEAGAITTASITTGTETVPQWLVNPAGNLDSAGAVCLLSRLGSQSAVIKKAKKQQRIAMSESMARKASVQGQDCIREQRDYGCKQIEIKKGKEGRVHRANACQETAHH